MDLSQYSDEQLAQIAGMSPPSSGGDSALSIRNNNPGNMKAPGGEFASFDSPKAGLAAMQHDLTLKVTGQSPVMKSRYGDSYQPTLRNVISTWAPPGENDTDNYINFVAKHSGLDPDQPLTPDDVPKIMQPMVHMEGGQKASSYFGKLMGGLGDAIMPSAQAAAPAAAQPDLSSMSDEALMKIAGQQPAQPAQPGIVSRIGASPVGQAVGAGIDAATDIMGNLAGMATGKPYAERAPTPDMDALRSKGWAGTSTPEKVGAALEALSNSPPGKLLQAAGLTNLPGAAVATGLNALNDAGEKYLGAPHQYSQALETLLAPALAKKGATAAPAVADAATSAAQGALAGIAQGAKAVKEPLKAFAQDQFGGGPPLIKDAPSLTKADDGAPLAVAPKAFENAPSKLREYTEASGIDLNKTADTLAELQKIDPNATVMDAIIHDEGDLPGSSSNIYGLLKSISQNPGQARTMVAQMVARGKTASSDIGDLVTKSLGAGDYAALKSSLEADMKASGAAYDKAYANPVKMVSPAMGDLLARPAGQKALAAAETMAANEGATIRNLDGTLNTRGIDYVKRGIDDMINGQEGSGNFGKTTQAGRAFTTLKNGILNEADNLNPDFKAARAQFADPASQMTALEAGRNFFGMDKHEIAKFLKGKSPAEKKQFISGVSEAIQNKLGSVNDKTNPVNKIWNENNRGRFKALFPDEAAYKQFAAGMDLHQTKMQTNQVMAGSPTAQNINFDTKPVSSGIGNVIRATSDLPMFVGGKLADFADKALAKSASKLDGDSKTIIARILTSKDPQALKAVAERIKK